MEIVPSKATLAMENPSENPPILIGNTENTSTVMVDFYWKPATRITY